MTTHSSAAMPYFARPSRALGEKQKLEAYAAVRAAVRATIAEDDSELTRMVTLNCLLKTYLPYFYWVGFYLKENGRDRLVVGPYQGTLGCLYIDYGRGVCGTVAATGRTKIVDDTHALEQGKEHIACDPNSRSEIVLPVRRADGSLIGVLDVDSTLTGSFDHVDQQELEELISTVFG